MKLLSRIFCRQTLITLLIITVVIAVATLINLWGIRMAGDIRSWESWLKAHTGIFLVWHLLLYSGTGAGWIWMRKRVLQREPTIEARSRLRRMECFALASIVLLEVSMLFGQN